MQCVDQTYGITKGLKQHHILDQEDDVKQLHQPFWFANAYRTAFAKVQR